MGVLSWWALLHWRNPPITTWYLSGPWYGNISQNTPGIINGGDACVPTATVNSFFFLQNYFGVNGLGPNNGLLTSDNASNAVNELGVDMGLKQGVGVSDAGFIAGKLKYLSDHGLTNTVSLEYEAVDVGADITPTWSWIYHQLVATQDVEVGFGWWGGSDGHCVTVSSLSFLDANGDGIIDNGENAQLDFTDPWDGNHYVGTLTMSGGSLKLSYVGGAAGPDGAWGIINIAVAESIPEPSAPGLLALGGLALLWRRKRS